jgi:chemotaxis response regulator CheB
MKLFAVCFGDSANSPISQFLERGSEVDIETQDGGAAYKRISKMIPDVIVFDGDQRPSHVTQTLRAILRVKKLQDSQIIIVTKHAAPRFQEFSNLIRVRIVPPDEARALLPI